MPFHAVGGLSCQLVNLVSCTFVFTTHGQGESQVKDILHAVDNLRSFILVSDLVIMENQLDQEHLFNLLLRLNSFGSTQFIYFLQLRNAKCVSFVNEVCRRLLQLEPIINVH